jgi:hypothetical protein
MSADLVRARPEIVVGVVTDRAFARFRTIRPVASPWCVEAVMSSGQALEGRGMRPALKHLGRSIAIVIGVGLAIAGPVSANEPIDPNTLNPAPPDFFNATCERTG